MRSALINFATRFASLSLLRQARWEITLNVKTALGSLRPKQRALLHRVWRERPSDLRVNLGCGPLPAPGWLNIDGVAVTADLLHILGTPLPLPDGCAAMIFSEHVLEHLEYPDQARTFLREACRILKPGGSLRVIVPDAERAMRLYASGDIDRLREIAPSEDSPVEMVNRIFRENGFHRYAWDYALVERELSAAGFVEIRRAAFRDSALPELNLDLDEPERILQSLYVDATKP